VGSQYLLFVHCNYKEVNRYKIQDGIAVHVVGWEIFDVALYCGLTVINCEVFSIFYLLILLALLSIDMQKCTDCTAINLPKVTSIVGEIIGFKFYCFMN